MGNRDWLQDTLHKFLKPAMYALLISSAFRSLLGIVIALLVARYGTYDTWSPYVHIPLETIVFLGMFLSSDIGLGYTNTNCVMYNEQILAAELDEVPDFHGKADIVSKKVKQWTVKQDRLIKDLIRNWRIEQRCRLMFSIVASLYALNFIAQTAIPGNAVPGLQLYFNGTIEVVSVFMFFFVLWYNAARVHEKVASLGENAAHSTETGIERAIVEAGMRLQAGTQTMEDVALLKRTLPGHHPYLRLMDALEPKFAGKVYSMNDIYQMLGIIDENKRRMIRRWIQLAHEKGTQGMRKNPDNGQWEIGEVVLARLITQFPPNGQTTDKPRTIRQHEARPADDLSGQHQATIRTPDLSTNGKTVIDSTALIVVESN
jgi:hypothetical protein